MQQFEFKVVPAPRRGEKARGVKTTEERFAYTLTQVLNEMGREGWDYVRADVLPCDERVGLTGSKTSFQNMLVFRRALELEAGQPLQRAMAVEPLPVTTSLQSGQAPFQAMAQSAAHSLAPSGPRLGAAEPPAGPAPALGPAKGNIAVD